MQQHLIFLKLNVFFLTLPIIIFILPIKQIIFTTSLDTNDYV